MEIKARLVGAVIALIGFSLILFGILHDIPEVMGWKPLIMAGW